MQLVLLMTNLLLLLFPREHLHSQHHTGIAPQGMGEGMRLLQGHPNPALGEPKPHVGITASTREAAEPAEVLPVRVFAAHVGNFQLLAAF